VIRISFREDGMTRLRMAVIGVGHLGKEHARILSQLPDVDLVGVVDPRSVQAATVAQRCGTRAYADHHDVLNLVDAVVVAAPTAKHHAVAGSFLCRGIPVLVEKPLAAELLQAEELAIVAEERGVVFQVGHIERFNPAFEELQRRSFQPKFITCERVGGFTGRSTDVGAVLDLMIHDIDLILALVHSPVRSVEALGVAVLGGHEDVAHARITFADGCIAQFSASRVHPAPSRRMTVWGPEGFAGIDFAQRRITLTQPNRAVLHAGFDSRRLDAATAESVRSELHGRYLQTLQFDCVAAGDQLTRELQEFVHCVRTGDRPRVDGAAGRDAVALATQVLTSLRSHAWEGDVSGPCGPSCLPAPLGALFPAIETKAAA
jgi:predicted dehydrogenase